MIRRRQTATPTVELIERIMVTFPDTEAGAADGTDAADATYADAAVRLS